MSMNLMAKAMLIKVGNPIRKLVLLKLADQANDKGECWPSYKSIAEAAECSRRAAVSHIEWLEKYGFLRVEKRKIGNEQNLTNIYHLTLGNGRLPVAAGSEPAALGSEPAALGGGESAAPKPVNKNQSMNHSTTDVVHNARENGTSENGDSAKTKTAETAKPEKRKRADRHQADLALLAGYGIAGQVAEDWLTIRKAKRQPLTKTALELLQSEAAKCGMTAEQAVLYAIGNGWAGFRAEYLQNKTFGGAANAVKPNRINDIPKPMKGGAYLAKDVF